MDINRPFVCPVCSIAFKIKQFLQRHMTVHSEVRNFQCDVCGKTYKYNKGLNRHKQLVHKFPKNKQIRTPKCDWRSFLELEERNMPSMADASDKYCISKVFVASACPD